MRAAVFLAAAFAALAPAWAAQVLSDEATLNDEHHLESRQSAIDPAGSGVTTANGTTMDMAAWDRDTSEICTARLSTLDAASNPSGTAICYNIPMLNNQTGRFLADLRLYKISDPTGTFLGVLPQDLGVGVAYNGATVLRVDNTTDALSARDFTDRVEIQMVGMRAEPLERRDTNPQLLQTYSFKGQIDTAKITADMTEPALEALVIPTLTLSAVNSAGQTVTTNVSANEASFLIGVFSDLTFQSAFSKASDRVKVMQQQLAQGEIAFVLPGVHILIFPIGLVITSVWLVIGIVAYGFGTYQRYSHAHAFKTRKMVVGKQGGKTF
jgi:hypothetical protein